MTSADTAVAGRARRLLRAGIYGVVVAGVITTLAFAVRTQFDPLIRLDDALIADATGVTRDHETFRSFLIGVQRAASPTVLYVLASGVCLWVWLRERLVSRAWWAFVTMMIGWVVALGAKYVVQRARPVLEDPVSHSPGYSFPSGHAANAAIATTALVVLLWPLIHRRATRVAVLVLAGLFVVGVCLDRVFLGVHFPSDVTGGVLLGCGLVFASYAGYVGWSPPTDLPDDADPGHRPTNHSEPSHSEPSHPETNHSTSSTESSR